MVTKKLPPTCTFPHDPPINYYGVHQFPSTLLNQHDLEININISKRTCEKLKYNNIRIRGYN